MGVRGARRTKAVLAAAVALLMVGGTTLAVADRLAAADRGPEQAAARLPGTTSTLPAVVLEAEATTSTVAPAPPAHAPAPPQPVRHVTEQPWVPFAVAADVVLHHPSARVERIGFHESNHDGARAMAPADSAVQPTVLETRERGTAPTTAADIVADPGVEIRSPVTGNVVRGGGYTLYCDNRDEYLVIEPDSHPGWEVKLLHISGLRVRKGDRVVAGQTVVADRPTQLPFESQVDEIGPQPAWPHVHVEVVDPSIPDRPNPGGGGSC